MEGAACAAADVAFRGLPVEPLWSLRSARGWRALIATVRATGAAKTYLREFRPDAVFSTGGYSAGPAMAAARSLGVPFAIHEANSVPGRANRIFAARAASFTATFRATEAQLPGVAVVRTGQPIRRALREAAARPRSPRHLLVTGGSQGSAFLNGLTEAAATLFDLPILQVQGRAGKSVSRRPGHEVVPFLEAEAMADAYAGAFAVVGRSGGSCAEFALFGLPSVLVPLPTSADDHQLHNAREIADLAAADVLWQPDDPRHADLPRATPETLAAAVRRWAEDGAARETARANLEHWDVPDATERILDRIVAAATRSHA